MKNFFSHLKWFYFTRGFGAAIALYELLLDKTSERGTIILAAFGVMGLDYVSRRKDDKDKKS